MCKALGVVEVQPAVDELGHRSPLAGIAARHFGGKTLLEWVVRRVSEAQRLNHIVVLAGDDSRSRRLVQGCPPDAEVYFSQARDPLGRFADVVNHFRADAVVRMNVSHPFVDPVLIDSLVTAAGGDEGCDYACYRFSDGRLALETKVGVFTEWCRGEAVLQANEKAEHADDRRDATGFLRSHPEHFARKLLPVPGRLDRDDLRLAIQDDEDWEHVQIILDALGPESLDWQYIAALLERQPSIRQRMLDLNLAETALV